MRLRCFAYTLAAFGVIAASPAWALFDDDEARRQISELRTLTNSRLETQGRAQLDLSNQIEALKSEVARLHGLVETLTYELETTKRRQQDFYVDHDERLRKIEGSPAAMAGSGSMGGVTPKAADPAAESKAYEAALNQFKAGKYGNAASAFDNFVKSYPESDMAPSAQYWLGNSFYGQRDCKKSIEAQKTVVTRWPTHPKASDAMLNIATCLQELGDSKSSRQVLESLVAKYPGTSAANSATQRLKK